MSREMKDSGIEWIGETPFNVTQAKRYVNICHGSDPITEGAVPVYGSGSEIVKTCGEYKIGPCVLLGRKGTLDKPQYIEGKYWNVDTAFDARSKNNGVNIKYYYYQMLCFPFSKYSTNTALPSMTQEVYKTAGIVVPSLLEQQQIVQFLDEKCSAIDTAIEKTKGSIEKLEEYKKAVITKAVTKGLNPDVKMKDSGVEWIGEVPEGWEVKRLKYLFYINSGATPKSDNTSYWDGNIKWVTPADFVTEQKWLSGGKRNITEEGYNSCSATIVPSGSIIFSKRAPVGLVVLSAEPLCTNQGCLACVPKTNVEAEYYYYVMSVIPEQFERLASGTTFKEISLTEFMNFKIPAPSIKEQRKIVEKLKERCSSIDSLIAEKQTAIDKWTEYKKSLIYYVVTGKIDCRGESI